MNKNNTLGQPPVSVRNFVNVIFKWKKAIAACFITIVLTITLGSFLITPIYRSTSKVLFLPDSNNDIAMLFGISVRTSSRYGDDKISSEIEILTSRPVIERVIKHLELEESYYTRKKADTPEKKKLAYEQLIADFQKIIIIDRVSGSDVLNISYDSSEPKLAQSVVNTLVDSYVQYREELYNVTSEYEFYNHQIGVTDKHLNELEERLATFKYGQNLPAPELQTQIVLAKLADFEKSVAEVRRQRINRESTLNVIEKQQDTLLNTSIPSTKISDSPSRERYIANLRSELLNLELQRSKLLQKFTPEYIEIKNLDAEIEASKLKIENEVKQIIQEERIAIKALEAEENVLQRKCDELNEQLRSLSKVEYELGKISRGIDDNREVYSMLLKQREQSKITMAKNKSLMPVKIITRAFLPLKPVKPNYKLNLIFSVLIGLVFGIGLAFILEHFTHTVDTPEDVEKYLGYDTLASVNYFPEQKDFIQTMN